MSSQHVIAATRRGRPPRPELVASRCEQILDAATRLFAAVGYHQTDLQKLADGLQLGKGTIYRYFASKEALFLAAVDRVMVRLRERIDEVREQPLDPLERISRAMQAYLAFFDSHPEFVELLILERAVFRDRKKPTYFEHRERNVGTWRALYQQLIDAGRVRPIPPETISDAISSTLYGAMFTNFFAGRHKSLEIQAAELVDVLFRGILSDDERSRCAPTARAAEENS
jgi:AcrR family transcriptional regulator